MVFNSDFVFSPKLLEYSGFVTTSFNIKLTNSSSTSQKINVSFIEPTVMKLEDEEKTLNSNNKIMVFENPFSYSVTYQLKISSDNGILFYADLSALYRLNCNYVYVEMAL